MLDKSVKFLLILFFGIAGGALAELLSPNLTDYLKNEVLQMELGFFKVSVMGLVCILLGAGIGGGFGYFAAPFFIRQLKRFTAWVDGQMNKMPIHDVVAGAFGLAIGLIIANLISYSFARIPVFGDYIPVAFSIVLGYLGIQIMISKRKDVVALFSFLPKIKEVAKSKEQKGQKDQKAVQLPYKVLDTSVIIDGRIADLCDTGFVEGTLLIPVFVLEELQHIADSADLLKRTRGRRGLDILQKIRTESRMKVEITNEDFEDIAEVDSKLVALAQKVQGKIITNDFNLNKVAQLRGVEVLNINELSNAIKPVVIPGERMNILVVKEGKEQNQGVAYLDDGTMIVVENGQRYIGSQLRVEVTSALQTAAGRMIFAKPC